MFRTMKRPHGDVGSSRQEKPPFLTTSIQTAEVDPFCPTEDDRIW